MAKPPQVRRRPSDPARQVAFDALRAVHSQGAYANLVLAELLAQRHLTTRDAAFATELVSGTCRLEGTYDAVLTAASGRPLSTLQPAVVDVLRLGAHQLLSLRVPGHAAVAANVNLAAVRIGERVTGLVNAVLRKVAAQSLDEWLTELTAGLDEQAARSLRTHHPSWIVAAYADLLPPDELDAALAANNVPAQVTLAARPGLATRAELGGTPTPYSPWGAWVSGRPADVSAVAQGRAGVQDEGSQLVALALARAAAVDGPWLDLCAGPGGKAALLGGLAGQTGERLVASERQPHRARLVAHATRKLPAVTVLTADATRQAWHPGSFARVLADVPCTGLGALRRRPEVRWRRQPADLDDLVPLQENLLTAAITSCTAGGVVAYVTCSPHQRETEDVVAAVLARTTRQVDVLDAPSLLPEVPDTRRGERFVQLWPHRHGTDAMFLALLRPLSAP